MIEVDLADKIWLVDDWFGYYYTIWVIYNDLTVLPHWNHG
jgi:hypothetical protein